MPEPVRLASDPILRVKCDIISDLWRQRCIEELLEDMHATMTAENGIGLAANQIGYNAMVFILKNGESYVEYINAEILSQEDLVDFENEGCLSIPGVSAKTKRYNKLKLRYIDRNGIQLEKDFEAIGAFAVQHEMDHLNGKLFIDQFGPVKKDLLLGKHKKFLRESRR